MFVLRWLRLVQPCRKLLLPGETAYLPMLHRLVRRCTKGSLAVMLHFAATSAVLRLHLASTSAACWGTQHSIPIAECQTSLFKHSLHSKVAIPTQLIENVCETL